MKVFGFFCVFSLMCVASQSAPLESELRSLTLIDAEPVGEGRNLIQAETNQERLARKLEEIQKAIIENRVTINQNSMEIAGAQSNFKKFMDMGLGIGRSVDVPFFKPFISAAEDFVNFLTQ